jgi:hypothetical protein
MNSNRSIEFFDKQFQSSRGMALVLDRAESGTTPLLVLLAVMLATAAWGVDNTLSRAVAERDPGQVAILFA